MSSEDYLDKLLQEMMEGKVAGESEQPSKADQIFTDIPEKISDEIPQNVDSMGVVIDKAPSLVSEAVEENVTDNDISELMADILPSMNEGDSDIVEASDDSADFKLDPNKTIGDYLDEADGEDLASIGEDVSSMGEDVSSIGDDTSAAFDFPSMPVAPEIPEVSNQDAGSYSDLDSNISNYDNSVSDNLSSDNLSLDNLTSDFLSSDNSGSGDSDSDISDIKKELQLDFGDDLDSSGFDDEADIEKMIELARNAQMKQHEAEGGSGSAEPSLDDLLAGDSTLAASEISSLLDKDENNVAVDEGISALINDSGAYGSGIENDADTAGADLSDGSVKSDPKSQREAAKAEKKRLKEEKKKQKEAEKEAKRKEKAEKAAAKKAAKTVSDDDNSQVGKIDFADVDALLAGADEASKNGLNPEEGTNSKSGSLQYAPLGETNDAFNNGTGADGSNDFDTDATNAGNTSDSNGEDADAANIFGGGFDSFADFNSEEAQPGPDFEGDNADDSSSKEFSEPGTISDVNLFGENSSEEDAIKEKEPDNKKSKKKSAGGAGTASGDESTEDGSNDENAGNKKNPFKAIIEKIKNFLTESDDEEDDEKSEIILSEENSEILDELAQEGDDGGKKKGKKKGKKDKKDKKGKDASDDITNPEDLPEKPEKKPKKAKKEKKKKNEEEGGKPEKKLPVKKVAAVVLMGIALAAALIFLVNITSNYSVKKTAREAYKSGDYQTCYQDLFGKELSESETVMYNQSECILKIRLWYREYEMYVEEGSEVKALDSLIQSVNSYPGLYASSKEYNCLDKIEPEYENIIGVLSAKYGLSEEDAIAIASLQDDVVYSRIVNAVAKGVSYTDALDAINNADSDDAGDGSGENSDNGAAVAPLEDKLPEEEGMGSNSFIEP